MRVAIPFERTTTWRLRFVIVPYYSLRFGFRPGGDRSITGQSPLISVSQLFLTERGNTNF